MSLHDSLEFSRRGNALIGQEMFRILDRAKKLEQKGERIFHLELGEPKIVPPKEIIDETVNSLRDGKVGYCTPSGLLELREKIVEYYSALYRDIAISNIAISPANLLISQFLDIVCNYGDRIVLFPPFFPTYLAASRYIGLDVQCVFLSPQNGFQLTKENIDKAFAYNPKVIIINSGNNPTGAVYSKEVLVYLVNKCEESGCWLLSDETYSKLNYSKEYYSLINHKFPKLMVITSFSKMFAVPGFRTGVAIADSKVIDKITLSTSTLYSCLPIFVQLGVCIGVQSITSIMKDVVVHYKKIIRDCMEIINANDAIFCHEPEAGFYLFLDIRRTCMDDVEFTRQLLEKHKTAVTPGESFGYKGFVRASICGESSNVIEGIKRLIDFADVLKK